MFKYDMCGKLKGYRPSAPTPFKLEVMDPEVMDPMIVDPKIMDPKIMDPEVMDPEVMIHIYIYMHIVYI